MSLTPRVRFLLPSCVRIRVVLLGGPNIGPGRNRRVSPVRRLVYTYSEWLTTMAVLEK